jgi:hypothetical protein
MACAHDALLRALKARVQDQPLEVRAARSEAWASATFCGARHSILLALAGPEAQAAAMRFTEGLDVTEFRLPGHLVADIAVIEREDRPDHSTLTIEALTVEDR